MVEAKLHSYKENLLRKRTEKLNKDFIFLEGCAEFSNSEQFQIALSIAKKYHEGQLRGSWEPYLSHVVDVTIELLNRGIRNSNILTSAILHDILEECSPIVNELFLTDAWINSITLDSIIALTKEKGYNKEEYYQRIKENEIACIVKLADRLHNLGTMSGSFDLKRTEKYLKETKEEILPIAKYARKHYVKNAWIIMSLKRDIERLITTIEILFLEHGIDIEI